MLRETKELVRKIEDFIERNEDEIILELAMKFGLDVTNKTTGDIHKDILNFEKQGNTGNDCGWIYVLDNSDIKTYKDEAVNYIFNYIQKGYIESDYITIKNYHLINGNPLPSIEFNMKKYPLRVQSTTIKYVINNYIIKNLDLDMTILSKLD